MTSNVSLGRWFLVAVLASLAVLLFISGAVLIVSSSGAASSHDVEAQGAKRDCVTTLQAARRNVFDDVDIYKAHAIQMLSDALLNAQRGVTATQADIDAYDANNQKLTDSLKQASALPSLDHLIAHGGTVAGVSYPACPD